MTTIKYIGRTTDFCGKTLWEIVGNLKNFGVGRIVTRNLFAKRYPEPSYLRIVKVETLPSEEVRKVKVTVEKTFRGRTYPKLVEICSASYKADYRLIPKDEEGDYCKVVPTKKEVILPQTIDFPPLLKAFIVDESGDSNPRLKLKIKQGRDKNCRIANDSEKSNIEIATIVSL